MDTIGEQLRQARIQQGLTIDDLQRMTKIQRRYLSAIESNDFDVVPSDYYTRTFIRQYADAVGINPVPLIKRFDSMQANDEQATRVITLEKPEEQPLRVSRKEKYAQQNKQEAKKGVYVPVILLAIVVAIIVGTIIYAIRLDTAQGPLVPKPDKTTIMGSSQSSSKEKDSSSKEDKKDDKKEDKKKETKKNIFTLEADYGDVITYKGTHISQPITIAVEGLDGPSWVGVQENGSGNLFYQDTVQAGETLTIDVPENIQNMDVIVGAANNVALKVNDKAIDFNKENPITGTKSITLFLSSNEDEENSTEESQVQQDTEDANLESTSENTWE